MSDFCNSLFSLGPEHSATELLFFFVLYLALGVCPVTAFLYLVYYLLTSPLRRNERARLFLDFLEMGLRSGRTPEATALDVAATHDPTFGAQAIRLANFLRQGRRLSSALEQVPGIVPPQTRAILKTGEALGAVQKVIPAARLALQDSVSQVRGALNYVVVLAFVVTPATVIVPFLLWVFVLPKYREVFSQMMEGASLPAFTRFVFGVSPLAGRIQILLLILVWGAAFAYIAGPRLTFWFGGHGAGIIHRLQYALPWRRKRLQRDFSSILAVLLDAQVPEPDAVRLAGESTANSVLIRRAERVRSRLAHGIPLPEALSCLDSSGELQWRLGNALRPGSGFARALAAWHDTLDAKAFQLEQTAAQVTSTCLVLLNGLFVASIVLAVFLVLVDILSRATLW